MSALVIDLSDLLPARRALDHLAHLRIDVLLEQIGGELEAQTRARLSDTKTDPDGNPWKEWSEAYAERAKPGAKLLEREGNLIDSISFEVGPDAVTVGSNLVYAATHQYGRGAIPARPFLGVGEQNLDDLKDVVLDFLAEVLRR